jgi:hypothetical protein
MNECLLLSQTFALHRNWHKLPYSSFSLIFSWTCFLCRAVREVADDHFELGRQFGDGRIGHRPAGLRVDVRRVGGHVH